MKNEDVKLVNDVKDAGFDCALAIATNEEVKAGAACGQMALAVENDEDK